MSDPTQSAAPTPEMTSMALTPDQSNISAPAGPQLPLNNASSATNPNGSPNSDNTDWHGNGGFLSRFFSPLVNMAGKDTKVSVDDNGQMQQDVTQAAPGTMFKHMLVGALSGLAAASQHRGGNFGTGLGEGFAGAEQAQQERNDRARQQAVQQFQMKKQAQQAADQHQGAQDESHLRATEIVAHNAQIGQIAFNMAKDSQEFQDNVIKQQSAARDYMVKNGGTTQSGLTWDDVQKKMAADPSTSHSLHAYITGETQALDQDGKPIMQAATDPSGNPILNAATNQPVMRPKMNYTFDLVQTPDDHILTKEDVKRYTAAEIPGFDQGKVKAGQTIQGSRWFNLEEQYQQKKLQDLSVTEKQAAIARDNASAAAEGERVKDLALDISDKKLAKQAKDDWGTALQYNNNDPAKASDWLKRQDPNKPGDAHFIQSFNALASAESMDIANNGETESVSSPDGTTKTVIKKQRLFSTAPMDASNLPDPPAGKAATILIPGQTVPAAVDAAGLAAFRQKYPHGTFKAAGSTSASAPQPVKVATKDSPTEAGSAAANIGSFIKQAAPVVTNQF